MIYQGSKARLKKYIVPILQKCIDENDASVYIEPFVGGANIIDSIRCKFRVGSDNNSELIELLKYMSSDTRLSIFPERCSFEHYSEVRESRKLGSHRFSVAYTAGIGYFASYGGRYFDGGYGRDPHGVRDIYAERLAYARKQAPFLKDITFFPYDYRMFRVFGEYKDCVFYLDPPYRGTKGYNGKNGFNYDEFYEFCRELSRNNWVFISEYWMPDDFECIWQMQRKVMQKSGRLRADAVTEKLFVYRG